MNIVRPIMLQSARAVVLAACVLALGNGVTDADDFAEFVQPLLASKCVRCHGGDEVNGEINLKHVDAADRLLSQPKLIKELIDVVSTRDMPPEGEPEPTDKERARLLAYLKSSLRTATADKQDEGERLRRLNRFQYNNAVRDLFQLDRDIFPLPEKLLTRHSDYLHATDGKMPDQVRAACHSLNPRPGLKDVKAFPKDLRAAHGYDNQANQLTLSPLLLDAFLRLSVSIVESPDFNEQTVGIWNEFFKEPQADADRNAEVRRRLSSFLRLAFRGPVEQATLDRYTAYTATQLENGRPFPAAMKKTASAVLCSPLFLYRSRPTDGSEDQYALASRLSFFLWASGPDDELLDLAERGELSKPEQLRRQLDRMQKDRRIERFLDTFPAQWMQLENVLAATPDPQRQPYFRLDQNNPASLQMVAEPLLLFDAVFIEDRPVTQLISPNFSYQSEFLKAWYSSDLEPPDLNTEQIVEMNRRNEQLRQTTQAEIAKTKEDLAALLAPVRERLLVEKSKDTDQPPVDLKPYSAWEFDGDLKDAIGGLHLDPHGKVDFQDGMVMLDRSYLLSKPIPFDLRAKSLEVWCVVDDVNQRGGGMMGIQGPGDFFDTIVLGERQHRHWISGSNGFSRTLDFPESTPEDKPGELLHLVMVYLEDGTTTLYRNGLPYGKPFRKGQATFPKDRTSVIFGLRHLPAGGNKYLKVKIDKARFYNRALTADEVAEANSGHHLFVTNKQVVAALSPEQKQRHSKLTVRLKEREEALSRIPPHQDPNKYQQEAKQRYENNLRNLMRSQTFHRVASADPRYGGVITNAAMLSMTSGPDRTHPIARGTWIIEVIFNDPPPPPPNDVPPLQEDGDDKNLTIRERFAKHRESPDCAGCHARIDPLGFALENFDITGRWRDKYDNGRKVDASGTLMRKHQFDGIVKFKQAIAAEDERFAKAFAAHLLRFAVARELGPADALTVDEIANRAKPDGYKLRSLLREVVLSKTFREPR